MANDPEAPDGASSPESSVSAARPSSPGSPARPASHQPAHRQPSVTPDGRHRVADATAVPMHPTLVVRLPQPGHAVRAWLARLVWVTAVLAALVLAAGILIVELGGDSHHGPGSVVVDLATVVAAPFSGVFHFHTVTGGVDETKTHLANWALAAAAYLVLGRVLCRLIQPTRPAHRHL